MMHVCAPIGFSQAQTALQLYSMFFFLDTLECAVVLCWAVRDICASSCLQVAVMGQFRGRCNARAQACHSATFWLCWLARSRCLPLLRPGQTKLLRSSLWVLPANACNTVCCLLPPAPLPSACNQSPALLPSTCNRLLRPQTWPLKSSDAARTRTNTPTPQRSSPVTARRTVVGCPNAPKARPLPIPIPYPLPAANPRFLWTWTPHSPSLARSRSPLLPSLPFPLHLVPKTFPSSSFLLYFGRVRVVVFLIAPFPFAPKAPPPLSTFFCSLFHRELSSRRCCRHASSCNIFRLPPATLAFRVQGLLR